MFISMKKLLRTLPLLSFLLVGCGTTLPSKTTSTTPVIEKAVYTSTSGVSLTYTTDWKYMENIYGSLVTFFAPQTDNDLFRENLGISLEKLPTSLTVDQYYATTKTQLGKLIKDFTEVGNENLIVDGLVAKKIIYEGTQQTYKLKWQQVFVIKEKIVYIFTYTANGDTFDLFAPAVDEMIKTVQLQ